MGTQNNDTDKELEAVLGSHKTKIKIIGTGGGGNNTVTRLLEVGIKGVDVIAVNTDAQDLLYANADQKVLIGKSITNGLGAGSDPEMGENSAKESLQDLEEKLTGSDMVFITCGLGGGTGTGSAPVIAEIAKKLGALTIAVVTLPFSDEGIVRWDNARKGLEKLQLNVDTVIVVQNDRLLDLVPDMPLNGAFKVADEILVNAVKGITELVTEKGLVNLDFADVRTIMKEGGLAMIGLGECETDTNAEEAAQRALENPLLDIDVTGARNALINISGGRELSLKSAKTIMRTVADKLDPSAKIIWGARLDEGMGNTIRVMLIVTCLKSSKRSATDIEMVIKKTEETQKKEHRNIATEHTEETLLPPDNVVDLISPEASSEAEPSGSKANSVFSDIFMEESEADISILEEAIKGISLGNRQGNEKYMRDVKNACSSLHNAAELFSYSKISEFVEAVGELAQCAIDKEFDLSESLLDLFRVIPQTLRKMISGEDSAFESAEELLQKFTNILELLQNPSDGNNADRRKDKHDSLATNEKNDGKDVKSKVKENGKNVQENPQPDGKPEQFSNVSDAVKYFDKLF